MKIRYKGFTERRYLELEEERKQAALNPHVVDSLGKKLMDNGDRVTLGGNRNGTLGTSEDNPITFEDAVILARR